MNPIFLVDAYFMAMRPIRSLPPFHGARWSAWLRFACKSLNRQLDEIALGLLPLRNGQNPICQDEILRLRLIADQFGLSRLPLLAAALCESRERGEFSHESLNLLFFKDAIGGLSFPPAGPLDASQLRALNSEAVDQEIRALQGRDNFTLRFFVPLRLKLPPGMKGPGLGMYCPEEFFAGEHATAHLLNKIRFLEPQDCAPDGIEIKTTRLAWHDMRYSRQREIALGGLVGEISCEGKPNDMAAQRLVLGQYLGAGKNPLFGLGYWRIPEIDNVRPIQLEECR